MAGLWRQHRNATKFASLGGLSRCAANYVRPNFVGGLEILRERRAWGAVSACPNSIAPNTQELCAFWRLTDRRSVLLIGANAALRPCPWHPWRFGIRTRWHANAKADLRQGLRDAKRPPCIPGTGRRSASFHRLWASNWGLFHAGNSEQRSRVCRPSYCPRRVGVLCQSIEVRLRFEASE